MASRVTHLLRGLQLVFLYVCALVKLDIRIFFFT